MDKISNALEPTMSDAGEEKSKVLKMGYLVKSPSRSRDKANYAMFWKVRWCVLAQVFSVDGSIFTGCFKFYLYYYEDEDSYKQHSAPRGYLDLSQCIRIKSCYKGCSGFNHIFEIECLNGKLIKFSTSSCKNKFLWFDVLFKHVYRIPIQRVRRTKVISQTRLKSDSEDNLTYATDGNTLFRKPRSISVKQMDNESLHSSIKDPDPRGRYDSGISSSTMSSISSHDDPPQLPPRRHHTSQESLPSLHEDQRSSPHKWSDDLDLISPRSQELDTSRSHGNTISSKPQSARRCGSLKETKKPYSLDEYFYCEECEKCEKSNSLGSRNCRRRPSQKEKFVFNADKLTDIIDGYDSTDAGIETRIYEEIDTEWLKRVRSMIAADLDQDLPQTFKETPIQSFECESHSEVQAAIIEKEIAFGDNAASQDAFSDPNRIEEEYVLMNFYSGNNDHVGEEDSTPLDDHIYQSMEEINPLLEEVKPTGMENDPRNEINDTENEHKSDLIYDGLRDIASSIKDIETGEEILKDIDEDRSDIAEESAEISVVGDFTEETNDREIEPDVEKNDYGINCNEINGLFGFKEQFNTKL